MKVFYIFLAWLSCLGSSFSQNRAPEDSLLFLAGTTYVENGNHAWLLWQAQDTSLLQGRTYAIYRKNGQPNSGHAFSQVALVQPTTRSVFLDARIDSLPPVLANKAMVDETLDGLFGDVMPAVGLSLGNKLSALLQITAQEPELFNRLYFLSRTEPAVAVAMGTGALVPMASAVSTFEVRTQPDGSNTPGTAFSQVVGRITLDRNNPSPITAPGPPVVIPDDSPKGHLNVALRWGVPDNLKRDTPLTYGYGVYRMEKTFAESNNHNTTPPTPSQLNNYLVNQSSLVQQVNLLPVLPTQLLTLTQAATIPLYPGADPPVPDPYFILDDNQAQAENKPAFQDGQQLYYFVATLDILGRPAAVSDGTIVTFCHRHPPLVPVAVDVENQYSYNTATNSGSTRLAVSWSPPPSIPEPSHYLVYRWDSLEEMKLAVNHSTIEAGHLVSGEIPHVSGVEDYEFLDGGTGAPALPAQAGVTVWYSVKAVLETSCGDLPSGHSAPGWGVLRDRQGPVQAGGTVLTSQLCPEIKKVGEVATPQLTPLLDLFTGTRKGGVPLIFKVDAVDPGIASLQVKLILVNDGVVIGEQVIGQRALKPGATDLNVHHFVPYKQTQPDSKAMVEICAKNKQGKKVCERFSIAGIDYPNMDPPIALQVCFEVCQVEVITEEAFDVSGGGSGFHNPTKPNGDPNPIEFTFTATPETQEYKLYERIDAGPLVMIEQGIVDPVGSEVTVPDYDHPAYASVVCYFLQLFDRHGNPSPMSLVRCIRMHSRVEMPTPLLAQVDHAGDTNSPQGTLRWSCEPNGVERFLVGIGDGLSSIEMEYSTELAPRIISFSYINPFNGGALVTVERQTGELINGVQHHDFKTGRVGGNFGNPALPGQYELTVDLLPGREYQFYVKSMSPAGDVGEPSNIVNFTWTESGPPTGPQVPWPARSLPPIDEDFIPEVKAQMIDVGNFTDPAAMIKIGSVDYEEESEVESGRILSDGGINHIPSRILDSPGYSYNIFTTEEGESLLPFTLYRYQVPNAFFPLVSGDVAQVAPLLEKLRTHEVNESGKDYLEIQDPLITIVKDPESPKEFGIYLIDSQGVVEGYTYVYLLVRFREDGEVDRTIPTNPLTIPFYQN
ncbi:MAG: hypothetical protein ACSHYB_04360 [Roseibacillus sp.]